MSDDERAFWREIYLASFAYNHSATVAEADANAALAAIRKAGTP